MKVCETENCESDMEFYNERKRFCYDCADRKNYERITERQKKQKEVKNAVQLRK